MQEMPGGHACELSILGHLHTPDREGLTKYRLNLQWLERQAAHIGIGELHHARMRWGARLLSTFHQRPCQLINVGLHQDPKVDQQTLSSGLCQCLSMHWWRVTLENPPASTHSDQDARDCKLMGNIHVTATVITLCVVWMASIGMKSSSSYLLRLLRTMV